MFAAAAWGAAAAVSEHASASVGMARSAGPARRVLGALFAKARSAALSRTCGCCGGHGLFPSWDSWRSIPPGCCRWWCCGLRAAGCSPGAAGDPRCSPTLRAAAVTAPRSSVENGLVPGLRRSAAHPRFRAKPRAAPARQPPRRHPVPLPMRQGALFRAWDYPTQLPRQWAVGGAQDQP